MQYTYIIYLPNTIYTNYIRYINRYHTPCITQIYTWQFFAMISAWLSDPFTGEVNLRDTKGHFELPGSELMNRMYIQMYLLV